MDIREGQIYEGTATLSGGDDNTVRRWIVVAPFGRMHIHSIDDAAKLHCWPISVIHDGLEAGTLRLIAEEPNHPAVQLQREKEVYGVRDSHLGLNREQLERMVSLLRQAISDQAPYVPHAAGEILTLLNPSLLERSTTAELCDELHELLQQWPAEPPRDTA